MPVIASSTVEVAGSQNKSFGFRGAALGIFVIAVLVRLPHLGQSLWCDEMGTYLEYVLAPWSKTVAAGLGGYIPNNHFLFTIITKIIFSIAGGGPSQQFPPNEELLRLPSLVAGAILPVAVVWPFRKSAPVAALLLALLLSVHPWLVAFSDEARGYSLMLLLGVVATNLLPDGKTRWPVKYGVALAAALYTIPVAALLLPAHAVAIVVLRRGTLRSWLRGMLIAVGLTLLLYLPMSRATIGYFRDPLIAPQSYADLLNQLPRFALTAQDLPYSLDPSALPPSAGAVWIYWMIPVLILLIGSVAARSRSELRLMLIAMGAATASGLLVPLFIHSAAQVRFIPWSAVWICVSLTGMMLAIRSRSLMVGAMLMVMGWMIYVDVVLAPNQPIREGIVAADVLAPRGETILVAFLTANGSVPLYGREATEHEVVAGPTMPVFFQYEQESLQATGHRPWVVASYEYLVRDVSPDFWNYFNHHYRCVTRLPGRISPVGIYCPRD